MMVMIIAGISTMVFVTSLCAIARIYWEQE